MAFVDNSLYFSESVIGYFPKYLRGYLEENGPLTT